MKGIFLSVIIPTYNRKDIIARCLAALERQTLSHDLFEVIVVDDGSDDKTREIVDGFIKHTEINVQYLNQHNSGANAARNTGIATSIGKLLLFINDDTIATPAMLEEHLKIHADYSDENIAVLGRVTISPEVPYSLFSRVHLDGSYAAWQKMIYLDWRAFYTCNVSVKKSFLVKRGLFEERMHYHEDLELSERLSHYGLKIIYNSMALGYHYHLLLEDEYLRIAEREGQSLATWYKKSPHLKTELASIGFFPTMTATKRLRYSIADLIFNRLTIPYFLVVARSISAKREGVALFIYKKIFQALKRMAIKDELHKR